MAIADRLTGPAAVVSSWPTRPSPTPSVSRGGSVPASTILLLESDADGCRIHREDPVRRRVHGHRGDRARRGVRQGRRPPAPDPRRPSSGPKSAVEVCREIRATPRSRPCRSCASARPRTSRSGSASSRPAPTTSWLARSTHARWRPGSRRCSSASSARGPWRRSSRADGVTLHRARRTVAVYSPKGGVGTTTIATNIAIAAAAHRPDRVVLVDFALQFGGVATLLNLDPKQTIADVVRDEASLREPELLRTYAMRHDSGLHVLAAPAAPEAAETDHLGARLADPADAARGLRHGRHRCRARRSTSASSRSSRRPRASCSRSRPRSARSSRMHALLEYLGEAGTIGLKSMFVLNNLFAREILKAA